jgi:hypothetical protein
MNEFQAAYENSRLTQEYPRDHGKIAAVVAAGRWAVVFHYTVYCNHTDAVLGEAAKLIADYPTEAEAQAAVALEGEHDNPECYYAVAGPRPDEVEVLDLRDPDPSDIPF